MNWAIAKSLGGESYHDSFGLGEDKKSVCAHNSTEESGKAQFGGTAMMAFGVFSSYIRPIDEDPDKCIDRR